MYFLIVMESFRNNLQNKHLKIRLYQHQGVSLKSNFYFLLAIRKHQKQKKTQSKYTDKYFCSMTHRSSYCYVLPDTVPSTSHRLWRFVLGGCETSQSPHPPPRFIQRTLTGFSHMCHRDGLNTFALSRQHLQKWPPLWEQQAEQHVPSTREGMRRLLGPGPTHRSTSGHCPLDNLLQQCPMFLLAKSGSPNVSTSSDPRRSHTLKVARPPSTWI